MQVPGFVPQRGVWSWAVALTWLGLLAIACNSTGQPIDLDMTTQKVVTNHAKAAFEVFFDPAEDKAPLTKFLEESASAMNREDLKGVWAGVPELQGSHPDFLEKQIFQKAMKDGDWPEEGSVDEKASFVDGTRAGLDAFLRESADTAENGGHELLELLERGDLTAEEVADVLTESVESEPAIADATVAEKSSAALREFMQAAADRLKADGFERSKMEEAAENLTILKAALVENVNSNKGRTLSSGLLKAICDLIGPLYPFCL